MKAKSPIKIDDWNHHIEDKREGQKRPKEAQPAETKERRELVPLGIRSYLTHSLSNVPLHLNREI
jgi:hypothetical protein